MLIIGPGALFLILAVLLFPAIMRALFTLTGMLIVGVTLYALFGDF